jgi:3',5'-cyclic AMP phosphodiesterase CpdA
MRRGPRLLAASDLHVGHEENRRLVEQLRPGSPGDWLLVAGDVGELAADIEWALRLLAGRFEQVVWAPGNHELWTPRKDPVQARGQKRYEYLVDMCRGLGIATPEDPYRRWDGEGGPLTIAPLFVLYDYSWRPRGVATREAALKAAHESGVVCTDEFLLDPYPYEDRAAWCQARAALTEKRLAECDPAVPLVLVNHYPLVRTPTDVMRYPEFVQWCGTDLTADWHTRFRTAAVVYGHLHIPRETVYDGVPFMEASLGYPREWKKRTADPVILKEVTRFAAL